MTGAASSQAPSASRSIGDLTSPEIGALLGASSMLCLPMGSMEQHGPHLPLNTDTVIAEAFTGRIVARWGEAHDLWRLPVVPIGLSREHAWAPGTLSFSVAGMTSYLRELARELVRALPCRSLLIINGHGGNRGMLEALGRELRGDFGLNLCALHLGAMISPAQSRDGVLEIHAGRDETSVMMALAPTLVRDDQRRRLQAPTGGEAVQATILDPAISWPWTSDDPALGHGGIIGDAREASAAHGHAIVHRVVEAAGAVIRQLRDKTG